MKNHAIVVLDETGSMGGQEDRVCSSMNEYVKGLPKKTRLAVFKFDSTHWTKFFSGRIKKWKAMCREDYTPGAMTPLWDAIGKAIAYAKGKASKGDKVMVMVDTDGFENCSKEHTQPSVTALIEKCKKKGWEFLFMSGGIGRQEAVAVGATGKSLGMSSMSASHTLRSAAYNAASSRTAEYFGGNTMEQVARVIDDEEDGVIPGGATVVVTQPPESDTFYANS